MLQRHKGVAGRRVLRGINYDTFVCGLRLMNYHEWGAVAKKERVGRGDAGSAGGEEVVKCGEREGGH